jgi:hypothetical protein
MKSRSKRLFIGITAAACAAAVLLLLFLPGSPLGIGEPGGDDGDVMELAVDEDTAAESADVTFADEDADVDDEDEDEDEDNGQTEKTDAETCAAAIEEAGGAYYTVFFYGQIKGAMDEAALKDFLEKAADTGISVSLEDLTAFAARSESAAAQTTLKEQTTGWDPQQTKAIISPKPPYGANDYTVSAVLPE